MHQLTRGAATPTYVAESKPVTMIAMFTTTNTRTGKHAKPRTLSPWDVAVGPEELDGINNAGAVVSNVENGQNYGGCADQGTPWDSG